MKLLHNTFLLSFWSVVAPRVLLYTASLRPTNSSKSMYSAIGLFLVLIFKLFIFVLFMLWSALPLFAGTSLWQKKENKAGARSMFSSRIACRVGHQLEVIINDKGKFTYDLATTISDTTDISDQVAQWLFPATVSSFGTHNGALPAVIMKGKDTISGSWKIENKQNFEDYRFSADVIDELSDGMLVISAKRSITAGQETYYIRFLGKIRIDDINDDNTIFSTKVSNALFEVLSEGQLSHGQQGGWLEQIYMRGVHPF